MKLPLDPARPRRRRLPDVARTASLALLVLALAWAATGCGDGNKQDANSADNVKIPGAVGLLSDDPEFELLAERLKLRFLPFDADSLAALGNPQADLPKLAKYLTGTGGKARLVPGSQTPIVNSTESLQMRFVPLGRLSLPNRTDYVVMIVRVGTLASAQAPVQTFLCVFDRQAHLTDALLIAHDDPAKQPDFERSFAIDSLGAVRITDYRRQVQDGRSVRFQEVYTATLTAQGQWVFAPDQPRFEELQPVLQQASAALASGQPGALDSLVHPLYGLYVVGQSGKTATVAQFGSLALALANPTFAGLRQRLTGPKPVAGLKPQKGAAPTFRCETGQFVKQGLFVDFNAPYTPISTALLAMKSAQKAPPAGFDAAAAKALEARCKHVIWTDVPVEAAFFYTKGRWYLLALDDSQFSGCK